MSATVAAAMRVAALVACAPTWLAPLGLLGLRAWSGTPMRVSIPLACSAGTGGQTHEVSITAPAGVAAQTRYTVRIDGVDSGRIEHVGLRYIFGMQSQWPIPAGTEYVEGSAHLIPGTGSDAVRSGARVAYQAGAVTLTLPGRVDGGSSYTPPSFEFELTATAPVGAVITQSFAGYRVTANAFLVGDVSCSCQPALRSFAVARTRVEPGP